MQADKEIRCSSPAAAYGQVLFGLDIPEEDVRKSREIFSEVPQLTDVFTNPTIATKKKENVIDRVFPESIRNFL